MGVKGLWQLLLPIGRRISIETLEGQILAVDASIWLTQFLKAMRDPETGKVQPAAHLKGFFRRLCRLLYHNIKPVFVFDGATPQVKAAELAARRKRREQFALVAQDTMQRMAKKLLHQKLLKEKVKKANQGNTTAFERGFAPGDDGEAGKASQVNDEVSGPAAVDDIDRKMPAAPAMANEMVGKCGAMSEEAEEINDWDDPAETEQEQLLRLGLYDSDDDNHAKTPKDDGNFDMSFLAALPPNRRKDAIENAQRKHRIQSRKEHMPAAGDPHAFSQVQMANFLKSSRLNKSIQTSLAAAVKHDNNGGDVMASDTTTRLELIRENEPSKPKRLVLHKRRREESESEDEAEWETSPSAGEGRQAAVRKSDKLSLSVVNRPVRQVRHAKRNILQIDDSDDESYGHRKRVPPLERDDNNPATTPIVVDSDSDTDEGGFLRVSQDTANLDLALSKMQPADDANDVEVEDVDRRMECYQNDRLIARELQDRLLAEAVQAAEDDKSASPKDGLNCLLVSSKLNEANSESSPPNDADAVGDDDESIAWEEGEATDDARIEPEAKSLPAPVCRAPEWHAVDVDVWAEELRGETVPSFDSDEDYSQSPAKRAKGSHQTVDATAALERAQKEAANLADWAGRVFRRAMKDAINTNGGPLSSPGCMLSQGLPAEAPSPRKSTPSKVSPPSAHSFESPQLSINSDSHSLSQLKGGKVSRRKRSPQRNSLTRDVRVESDYPDDLDQALTMVKENGIKWADERNKRERDMDTVTDEMKLEVMQLLQLFGVPYIEAPSEAESQCAELERLGLVDGIITEDSDVFVFGGKNVYKHIFEDQKFAEAYKADDAAREMGLGRNEMVALAMLLGGDYTQGVKGVGIVNAMEILQAFDFSEGTKEGLCMFKKWLGGISLPGSLNIADDPAIPAPVKSFHHKHKSARNRWVTPGNFPAESVLKAYSEPVVDSSSSRFSWGKPDAAGLLVYCNRNIGWSAEETNALLGQCIDRLSRTGLRQTRLDAYMPMRYEDSIMFANVRSKRLQEVLRKKRENTSLLKDADKNS